MVRTQLADVLSEHACAADTQPQARRRPAFQSLHGSLPAGARAPAGSPSPTANAASGAPPLDSLETAFAPLRPLGARSASRQGGLSAAARPSRGLYCRVGPCGAVWGHWDHYSGGSGRRHSARFQQGPFKIETKPLFPCAKPPGSTASQRGPVAAGAAFRASPVCSGRPHEPAPS